MFIVLPFFLYIINIFYIKNEYASTKRLFCFSTFQNELFETTRNQNYSQLHGVHEHIVLSNVRCVRQDIKKRRRKKISHTITTNFHGKKINGKICIEIY